MDLFTKCTEYIDEVRILFEKNEFSQESWDAVYELENEIRKHFGLPDSFNISSLLQKTACREGDIETVTKHFIEELQIFATDFLSATPQTDRQILEAGKAGREAFDNVLPYMNICTSSYCVYIYEELFCRGTVNTDKALAAFCSFSKYEDLITRLIQFNDEYNIKIDFAIYRALCSQSIPYLENYLQYQIDIHSRHPADKKNWTYLYRRNNLLSRHTSTDHFYITKIQCFQYQPTCFLNIIFEKGKQGWQGIIVQCLRPELEKILDHSHYNQQASLIRANLSEDILELDLRDFTMNQLEITGFTIGLERIDELNNGFFSLLFMVNNTDINPDQLPF